MAPIATRFEHKDGPVVISTGISGDRWSAYIVKDNGSLKRFRPAPIVDYWGTIDYWLRHTYKGKALKEI